MRYTNNKKIAPYSSKDIRYLTPKHKHISALKETILNFSLHLLSETIKSVSGIEKITSHPTQDSTNFRLQALSR